LRQREVEFEIPNLTHLFFNIQGAFSNFLTCVQNIQLFIKTVCKKDKIDVLKLPYKPEDCNLKPMVSTFLDIGSGFGKPNFHCALQIFPKESLGIEIVPARVISSQDHQYNFED